jgi:DNA-binding transcriptional MerR regulator
MKIAGLAAATGVTVATLKYYLREGLLHPGVATAVNQADYDQSHVHRVKLIRALVDLGRLSIADVRTVLAAVDDDELAVHEAFGRAQNAMAHAHTSEHPLFGDALAEVDRFVVRHGLDVKPDSSVRGMLADVLIWMGEFGWAAPGTVADSAILDGLVPALFEQAFAEIEGVPEHASRAEQVEYTVVGTIVFETAAAAVRRLAHEHASSRRFGTG